MLADDDDDDDELADDEMDFKELRSLVVACGGGEKVLEDSRAKFCSSFDISMKFIFQKTTFSKAEKKTVLPIFNEVPARKD